MEQAEARCNQEKLWQQFHKFVSSEEYKNEWEKLFKQAVTEVDINPLLYQHIADDGSICKFAEKGVWGKL